LLNDPIKRAKAVSAGLLLDTMVRAGIYTRHGRLRKEYGG
jgi:hypothetical protein